MHSQVTQPGPRGAWRGTDRSGGSRGPRSRTSRTRGRSPAPSWPPRSAPTPPAARWDRSRLGATRTGILMSSTFDSGERDHRKSLSSPTRLCSPPSWTCTAARGCASGGTGSRGAVRQPRLPVLLGNGRVNRGLGRFRLGVLGGRPLKTSYWCVPPAGGTNTASVARPQRQALSCSPVNLPIGGRGRVF